MESREVRRTRSLLAVAAGAVLFGTSGTARSLGSDGLDGLSVAAWRTVIGAIGLLVAARWRGERVLAHRWHPRPVAAAAVSVFGYQFAFFAAVDRIGVANATIVSLGTAPVAAGLLDRLMSKRPVHRRWVAGVALAVVGIVLLSGGGSGGSSPAGWIAAIAAGAAFPVYAAPAQVLVRDRPR
ncbi:MAG: DMT family transporter [Ilumatobacteraceae bacterium]